MFLQSRVRAKSVGRSWQLVRGWQWLGLFVFLGGVSLLSGCGASGTGAHVTFSHPQSTPVMAGPFHAIAQTFDGAFAITLDITPNRSGPNQFRAQVIDNHAHKPATHIRITLYTTMQDMPMGTDSVVLRAEGGGLFSATSNVLSMSGHWALGIVVQTTDHIMHKAGVSFVMSL
ncbi:MAG TPA: hypothetical protein VF458_04630 [Ktedonobacteraceae bacterium]